MTGKGIIRVHLQRGIFFALRSWVEWFYLCRPQGFLKMVDDGTGSVRDVCWRLLCHSIAIDERFLCGYRLIIDWRYYMIPIN